jgi:hypothetical protein
MPRPISRHELLVGRGIQLDLLNWQPSETVARFDDHQVRAADVAGRVCKAIAAALDECGKPRLQIAEAMSAFLGQRVSLNMLNAYASQAREDHQISVVRFLALIHATGDRRLLELLAEGFGWAVIERKYLPLISLAQLRERSDELDRAADAIRREARGKGIF